jgi:hypothetical protein
MTNVSPLPTIAPDSRFARRLLLGLVILVFAAALSQFVLVGLLSLALYPVALLVLTAAIAAMPVSQSATAHQSLYGIVAVSLACVGLACAAYLASSLAYSLAAGGLQHHFLSSWIAVSILSFAPAALLPIGLRLRLGWPISRLRAWTIAALLVTPLVIALFYLFSVFLPYSA